MNFCYLDHYYILKFVCIAIDLVNVIVEPPLRGNCELVGEHVNCWTSLDNHMVTLMYKCSYEKLDTRQTIDVPSSCMFLIVGHL